MNKILMATSAMGLALIAGAAFAQTVETPAQAGSKTTTLQEVVVTGQKRTQNLQKTSSTVVAISGTALQQEGRTELGDILKDVPGITITGADDNPSQIIIRGIGAESGPSDTPSVTIFQDGIPNAGNSSVANYDVAQVEVAMGPQGSVYGGDTSGGAIAINYNDPVFKYAADGEIGYGNYNALRATGMINIPLTDQLAVRGAFLINDRTGYLSNGLSDADVSSGRLKLRYQQGDLLNAVLTGSYTHQGGHGDGNTTYINNKLPSNPWTSVQDPNSFSHSDNVDVHAKIDANLDFGTLSFLPNYSHTTADSRGENFGSLSKATSLSDAYSFESRLSAKTGSPIFWQAGVFLSNSSEPWSSSVDYQKPPAPPGGVAPAGVYSFQNISGQNSRSIAVFGQTSITLPFEPAVRVVGGLRWQQDSTRENYLLATGANEFTYTSTPTDVNPKSSWHNLSWRGGLEWDVAPKSMVYATAATGYSPGTAGYAPGQGTIILPSQVVMTYEIGSKNRFLDNRLQLNVDGYFSQYTHYNTAAVDFTGIPPFFIEIVPVALTGATSNGFDANLVYRLTTNDRIGASVAGNWAKFGPDQVSAEKIFDNKQFPFSPHISLSPYYEHVIDLANGATVTGRIESLIQSPQFTDTTNASNGYERTHTVSNIYLTYGSANSKYSITLYVRNLENTATIQSYNIGNPMAGFPDEAILGAPRTYGFNIAAHL